MNLSQRSIAFSLLLHCSLVLGGIFLWKWTESRAGNGALGQEKAPQVVRIRPVTIASSAPPAVRQASPPASSAPPRDVQPDPGVQEGDSKPDPGQPAVAPSPEETARRAVPQASYPKASPRPSGASGPAGPPRQSDQSKGSRSSGPSEPAPLWTPEPSDIPSPAAPKPGPTTPGGRSGPAMPVYIPRIVLGEQFPNLTSASVVAEFRINPNGTFQVELVEGTGNPAADRKILEALLEARWNPKLENGQPVEDVRRVDLDLER